MTSVLIIITAVLSYCEKFNLNYSSSDKYELSIRGDFKVYLNDKYQGLNVHQIKGILDVEKTGNNQMNISGNVYQFKKTMRDNISVGNEIDKSEKCAFTLLPDGKMESSGNPVFPPLQGVPFFPDKDIKPGDIYENNGIANVALFNQNETANINIISKTKYAGKKEYNGNTFDYFEISYYYQDIIKSNDIKSAKGQHNLGLIFNNSSGKPVLIKDTFSEEFELKNGERLKQNGFYFYFYKLIVPMNKDKMIVDLKKEIEDKKIKDLEVVKKNEGVSITINNLKFKPDSRELLDSEKPKLNDLADSLKKIPERSFMIVGHTALFGTKEEQQKLSLERAKTIAEFLIKSGIPESRIFFTGRGADEPVAPNNSETNMQKNRRVEIIIQED